MNTHLLAALLSIAWLTTHCGDDQESKETRSAHIGNQDQSEGDALPEENKKEKEVVPEDNSAELEEKGLTNNGSPLKTITLINGAQILPVGTKTYWMAEGVYEDDSLRDITELVSWESSDPDKVELAPETPGEARAVAEGTSDIKVILEEFDATITMTVIP